MPLRCTGPIESVRTIVRLVERSDLPALLVVNGDEQVTRFLPYETWKSPTDGRAWYARMADLQAAGLALQFVVAARCSGAAIGTCLLFRYDAGSRRAELGYVLGRAYWGQGYMHEALTALIGEAFGAMGLRRLEAEVDPHNRASSQLLARLGFRKEGLLRERWLGRNGAQDAEVHGLLERDWRQHAGSLPGIG